MGVSTNAAKGIIGLCVGILGYLFNCITELVLILVFMLTIDYVTGITAAFIAKTLESRKSLIGIIKKIGYMLLLALAFFVDYVVTYLVNSVGIQSPVNGVFGVSTTLWLIGTEGLSILENLNAIGVPFPPFLKSAFKKLKDDSGNICETKKGGLDESY